MLAVDIRLGALESGLALESGSVPEAGFWGLVGCGARVVLVQLFCLVGRRF